MLQAADGEITGLKDRILEARKSIMALEAMTSASTSKEIEIVRGVLDGLRDDLIFASDEKNPNATTAQQLDNAISALQRIYRMETE